MVVTAKLSQKPFLAKNALDFQVNFGYTYKIEDICFQKKPGGSDTDYANPLGPIHLSETPTIAEGMGRR